MALVRVTKLWPSKTIVYEVSRSVSRVPALAANIQTAVDDWNANTVLRLRPFEEAMLDRRWISGVTRRGANPLTVPRFKFVFHFAATRCNSHVGMQGGRQHIRCLNDWNVFALVHEIGHAVGLYHEQCRIDRNTHVNVNSRILGADEVSRNYPIKRAPWAMPDGPYDCQSLMHYPATRGFSSRPGGQCAGVALGPSQRNLPDQSTTWLNTGDISAIRTYYRRKPLY